MGKEEVLPHGRWLPTIASGGFVLAILLRSIKETPGAGMIRVASY
jgi:hypothetical protein